MAKEKFVEAITDMEVDFAQWYTDICKKAELVDYSSVRGCIILRPYGYAIWEQIQKELDARFKATGHENVYLPLFIPESLLQKEKDHVEGFAPEVAWVTHGGSEELTERLCVRPTSETVFCEHYSNIIQSHRDLPKLYNQWCNIVRWEKTTRPFLRGREILWQEGHTAHATAEDAQEETIKMLHLYADFNEDWLALPVIRGQKTEREKFAGAKATYSIEGLMHDGKALQNGTTHNFGDGFAKAFDIKYTDKENKLQYVHQTSWGMTTRLIGAIIMTHGDNNGMILPPNVAPIQLAIIPVAMHKEGVLEFAEKLEKQLSAKFRVKLDASDRSPGWKYSEYEMKGVPLRLEAGPKDIEAGQVVLVRRDTREKISVNLADLDDVISETLNDIQVQLFEKARKNREERTFSAYSIEEIGQKLDEKPGFIKAMWCGSEVCEDEVKSKAIATSRNMPFEQEKISDICAICGKPAEHLVVWGRAY